MPKRVDSTQRPIVDALRAIGCSVAHTHMVGGGYPDISVGSHGRTFLLEIKAPDGESTVAQVEWASTWRGHLAIVRTPQEAIAAVVGKAGR